MLMLRKIAMLGLVLAVGGAHAAEPITSGPQTGEKLPGPFRVLNITGPNAGEKICLYCKNGNHPAAMIFARELSGPLVQLIKKIDAVAASHQDCKMGSFVIFLNKSADLSNTLKELDKREKILQTIFAVDKPAGPSKYQIAPEASITVLLYKQVTVKANYALRQGELTERTIDVIVSDLVKILPKD